jgi:GT2 family glycosyltransferase
MTASVVVCTFNRAPLLLETLHALLVQRAPEGGFEILVVDNNSADATRSATERLAAESPVPVRYVFEPRQGLSFARNTGIHASRGAIVAFVDDDVDMEPEWLRALLAPFTDPTVACTGGPIRPKWPIDRPAWVSDDWLGYLGITEFDDIRDTGEFRSPVYPWGGNIAFRRQVFGVVGLFPTDLGRIGNTLLSSEEIEVCRKIEEAGWRIRLAPDAVLYHKIATDRLTQQTFYHRTYSQGRSDAILDQHSAAYPYSKVRQFAASLFWLPSEKRTGFDRRCRERIIFGYVGQLTGLHEPATGGTVVRQLRAFSTFVRALLGTSRTALVESARNAERLESIVRERDQWLAERDRAIAVRDTDHEQLQRALWERQSGLDRLNDGYREIEKDRDGWRDVATQRQAALDALHEQYGASVRQAEQASQSLRDAQAAFDAQLVDERRVFDAERAEERRRIGILQAELTTLQSALWTRIGRRLALLRQRPPDA